MNTKKEGHNQLSTSPSAADSEGEISGSRGQNYSSVGGSSASSAGFVVLQDRDSLGRVNAATYRLGNGLVLQVTGLFQPDAPTVCIANCP